jgi:hypothetical protein
LLSAENRISEGQKLDCVLKPFLDSVMLRLPT